MSPLANGSDPKHSAVCASEQPKPDVRWRRAHYLQTLTTASLQKVNKNRKKSNL